METYEIIDIQKGSSSVMTIPEGGGWLTAKDPVRKTKEDIFREQIRKIRERRQKKQAVKLMLSKTPSNDSCGAGSSGGKGFSPGNTCAKGIAGKLKKDGGFTEQPVTGEVPTKGFAVSPYPDAEFKKKVEDLTEDDIYNYITKHAEKFTDPDTFVGGWLDDENGIVYLDVSIVKDTKAQATKIARKYGQEGIFDLGKKETIIVKAEKDRRKTLSRYAERARDNDGRAKTPSGEKSSEET